MRRKEGVLLRHNLEICQARLVQLLGQVSFSWQKMFGEQEDQQKPS